MHKIIKKIIKIISIFFLSIILIIVSIFGFIYNKYLKDLPPIEILQEDEKNIDYLFYDDIPEKIIKSTVAIEDRFYFERDFSSYKINVLKFLFSGNQYELISLIHHKLVRELINTGNKQSVRGYERILIWNYYADLILKKYSKEKILEMYLNKIIFLEDGTKLKNIGKKIFNKNLSELNNFEISVILSLVKSPKLFSPYNNYDKLMGYFYVDGTYNIKTRKYKKIDNEEIIKRYFIKFNNINISKEKIEFEDFANIEIKNGNKIIKYSYGRRSWVLFRMYKEGIITFDDFKENIITNYKYKFK